MKNKKTTQKKLNITEIQEWLRTFAKARDWEQYHTPKNLVMAVAGEVGELVEIFQWLTEEESCRLRRRGKERTKVEDEMADVFVYILRLADILSIDLQSAVWKKLHKNQRKYPVKLAKGNAKKYTELRNKKGSLK